MLLLIIEWLFYAVMALWSGAKGLSSPAQRSSQESWILLGLGSAIIGAILLVVISIKIEDSKLAPEYRSFRSGQIPKILF